MVRAEETARAAVVTGSALRVQASWRGVAARRKLRRHAAAAVGVQAAWRGGIERARWRRVLLAAQLLQARARGVALRHTLKERAAAAVCLQAAARGARGRATARWERALAARQLELRQRAETEAARVRHSATGALIDVWTEKDARIDEVLARQQERAEQDGSAGE